MNSMIFQLALAVVPAIIAITLHEAAHGYAAWALGDTTARDQGRLSLNPLRHVDRVGTIILPGILLVTQLVLPPHRISFMFGWAKPVPVAAWKFRDPRRGMAVVALAGPAMNFFLAWVGALLMPTLAIAGTLDAVVVQFLIYFMLSNLVLGLFNLLPIPPLDGGRIAVGVLPLEMARAWAQLERAGIVIVLLVVFVLPHLIGWNPVGEALDVILPWAFRTTFWLAGHDLGGSDGHVF
ncbi:MAG: site-2 protease family protein [Acetobacteraceae bacterium]